MTVRVHVTVRGRVQGVGFRWFVRETAQNAGITGWVRNLPDGSVELEAQGPRAVLDQFLSTLRNGHPYARIDGLESRDIAAGTDDGFAID